MELPGFRYYRPPRSETLFCLDGYRNGQPQYTTVLEIPPVDSPQATVKVAIAAKARDG